MFNQEVPERELPQILIKMGIRYFNKVYSSTGWQNKKCIDKKDYIKNVINCWSLTVLRLASVQIFQNEITE